MLLKWYCLIHLPRVACLTQSSHRLIIDIQHFTSSDWTPSLPLASCFKCHLQMLRRVTYKSISLFTSLFAVHSSCQDSCVLCIDLLLPAVMLQTRGDLERRGGVGVGNEVVSPSLSLVSELDGTFIWPSPQKQEMMGCPAGPVHTI